MTTASVLSRNSVRPAADATDAAQARAAVQGPPRSTGGVPFPQSMALREGRRIATGVVDYRCGS